MFRDQLHPVELASKLVREADLGVQDRPPIGPTAPNAFEIRIAPDVLTDELPAAYLQGLAKAVEDSAVERGWRLEGPVKITLLEDPDLGSGVKITAVAEPAPTKTWSRLSGSIGSFDIAFNRVTIGRGDSVDVRINDPHVSRVHALLWRDGSGVWVQDLGSANGTKVDGRLADGPVSIYPGAVLAFGRVQLSFRSLTAA